ncbi:MAG: hypothetical protein MI810_13435 [Flavobacteriales bacterium]|nr:hypothetical protein [Flavobacteriales bacterium]
MKNFLVLLLLVFSFVLIGCQSDKGKAIANFEAEFEKFHEAYPADEGTYTFKDYSELEKVEENGEVVGYTQTTIAVRTGPEGEVMEVPMMIHYNKDLTVDFF